MANDKPFSIRIFVADGEPDGLRIVEKSNWTGLGLVCSRSDYPAVRARKEFSGAAVYVLLGPGKNLLPRIYVGEAEVLRNRLTHHHQNTEFWTRFVAFTGRDGSLNKAHVRYLETRLIELARDANRADVVNGAALKPYMSEADKADLDSFVHDMLVLFPLLEVSAFKTADIGGAGPKRPVDDQYGLTGPFAEALGTDTGEGFVVKAGSKARLEAVASTPPGVIALRDALRQQGVLKVGGDSLLFSQDYVFDSPSSAACVVLGRSANGRTEWSKPDGRTLKDVQIASVDGDAPPE